MKLTWKASPKTATSPKSPALRGRALMTQCGHVVMCVYRVRGPAPVVGGQRWGFWVNDPRFRDPYKGLGSWGDRDTALRKAKAWWASHKKVLMPLICQHLATLQNNSSNMDKSP